MLDFHDVADPLGLDYQTVRSAQSTREASAHT